MLQNVNDNKNMSLTRVYSYACSV